MKKLLITASTFPRWEGDTEPRFILDYAKAMTKYFEVHVLVPMAPEAKEEEMMEGVWVHRFHYFPIHKWETLCYPGAIVPRIKEKKVRAMLVPFLLLSMRNELKKYSRQVDLVHAHWIIPQGIMQSGIKDVPYIVTGHGGDVTSLNFWPFVKMKKKCLQNAMVTVGVSEYICEKMRAIYPEISPMMISMGCDLTKFTPQKKNENFFSHDKKNIVFVGRLVEIKGLHYLIEVMKQVAARLYIVGSGPLEESLKEQMKSLCLQDRIVFCGSKAHDEIPEMMASADLFVAPSIVLKDGAQEGFGLVILEAMASGLPVVVGDSGGTKDIVVNGKNGYIVDAKNINLMSDRINSIICNDKLSNKMKREALKTSKKYSYEEIGRKYFDILKDIF